jgi:hypothetical protein
LVSHPYLKSLHLLHLLRLSPRSDPYLLVFNRRRQAGGVVLSIRHW